MPNDQQTTNDLTDDRIPIVLRRLKQAVGQNDKDEIDSIGVDQCVLLQNVTVSRKGKMLTRYGNVVVANTPASLAVDGVGHLYVQGGTKYQLMLANGNWYQRAAGGASWTSIKSGLANGNMAPHIIGNGYIFTWDGVNNVQSWNGTTEADEGSTNTSFPGFKFGIWHQNRFIVGKDTDSLAYFGDSLAKTFDRTTNIFKFGDKDNGLGRAIVDMPLLTNNAWLYLKNNSVYSVDSSNASPASWTKTVVDPAHGCVATRTAVPLGSGPLLGGVLYLSKETSENGNNYYRVRSVQRTLYGTHAPGPILSLDIESTLNGINEAHETKCAAYFFNNKYILAFPSGSSTSNDTIAVLDFTVSDPTENIYRWQVYSGWNAAIFDLFEESSIESLYFGDASANSRIFKCFIGATDNGTAISAKVTGRAEDGDYPELNKTWEFVEVFFSATDTGPVTVRAIIEGSANTLGTVNTVSSGPNLPINLPFNLQSVARISGKFPLDAFGIGRTISIEVENSISGSQMAYLGYILTGWAENLSFRD